MQEEGCGVLRTLCFNNAENAVRVGSAGGIEAVVACGFCSALLHRFGRPCGGSPAECLESALGAESVSVHPLISILPRQPKSPQCRATRFLREDARHSPLNANFEGQMARQKYAQHADFHDFPPATYAFAL